MHESFIRTSITSEMDKACQACVSLGYGIDNYTLKDYMFQSLLLRLTGFVEQKLKCICWDIATLDYEYRRRLLNNDDRLGEYSSLDAKSKIYTALKSLITRLEDIPFDINNHLNKAQIAKSAKSEVETIFNKTTFFYWAEREYKSFSKNNSLFKDRHFANDGLLEECLANVYNKLYMMRNSIAHNTSSYQENIPALKKLVLLDNVEDNYFTWFATLNLIDKIFSQLYFVYVDMYENMSY